MATSSIPAAGATGGSSQLTNPNSKLKVSDFINMMVTQLQNQDPLDPVKNQDLLAQMSQIGQLQTSNDLDTSLKGLVLQNSLGAAGNLIGKAVQGLDEQGAPLGGIVSSVRVQGSDVFLELDSGKELQLGSVTSIAAPTPSATTPTPATAVH